MGGEKVRGHNGKDKKGGQNIKQLSVNFKRPENCVGFVFRVEIFYYSWKSLVFLTLAQPSSNLLIAQV